MSWNYASRKTLRRALCSHVMPDWLMRHKRRSYIIQAVLASPPWVRPIDFKALYEKRDALTASTGVRHVLDHVVPLNHPMVCGLNVPWNVRVIPAATNAIKSNYWCEWQGDLFVTPEQFKLL